MRIKELAEYLEHIAPLSLQESYDNSGLIIGDASQEIRGVLICLDVTEPVVEEAIEMGCNLIVSHHPLIFQGIKRITGENYIQRCIAMAIKRDIAIYAIHTNLDNTLMRGVNTRIAEMLGIVNYRALQPKAPPAELAYDCPPELIGTGLIGELPEPMPFEHFLYKVKETMRVACLKHTALPAEPLHTVALCGGAGSFLLRTAIQAGAQMYISADFKYHEFFIADGKIVIVDIGHYESEQFTMELLKEMIREKFTTFACHVTRHVTNPVHYL